MTEFIRTKTKASGPLTDAEKVSLDAHINKWAQYSRRTDPIDDAKITEVIENLYQAADLKKPRVVVVSSPIAMVFAYGAAAALAAKKGDSGYKGDPFEGARIIANGTVATKDVVDNAVARCKRIAGQAGIDEAANWYVCYQGGNMWSERTCYMAALRDVLGLDLPEPEKYNIWEQASIHGGFRVVHEDFCIVCDFPDTIKVDDANRPHCEDGPSYRWRDGWALYHWHGVAVPENWIMDKKSLTAQIALTWSNIEQRRAACEILGWDTVLKQLDGKTIDTDVDPEIGQLIDVEIPDIGKCRFLKVLCGTGRQFAIPVPPEMQTALQANAWTFGLDEISFNKPEIRT